MKLKGSHSYIWIFISTTSIMKLKGSHSYVLIFYIYNSNYESKGKLPLHFRLLYLQHLTLLHFYILYLQQQFLIQGEVPLSNKVAKIRNRYNQVPHLTQDTNGKVTNSQKTPQTRAKRSAFSQQVTTKHI